MGLLINTRETGKQKNTDNKLSIGSNKFFKRFHLDKIYFWVNWIQFLKKLFYCIFMKRV